MKTTAREQQYARMGMAAMLPGMQRAIELLTEQISTFKALLNDEGAVQAFKRQKMPNPKVIHGPASYWAKLTPEERAAEMQRRLRVHDGLEPSRRKENAKAAKTVKKTPPKQAK